MKMQIIGLEGSTGVGKTSGNAYDMGSVHTIIRMAPPLGKDNIAQGMIGTSYRCTSAMVRSVAHLPLPFWAEVDVQDVSRFGKREQQVMGILPLEPQKKAA